MANYPYSSQLDGQTLAGRVASMGLPSTIAYPVVMGTPPTVTSGASATLVRRFHAATNSATILLSSKPVSGGPFTVSRTVLDRTGSGSIAVSGMSTVTGGLAGPSVAANMQVSFNHVGQNIEIAVFNATGLLIRVNGEYVSFTPTVVSSTQTWIKLAFASRAVRRIDVIGQLLSFSGVAVDAGDSLYPAPVRGPRVLCLGDSFTQPSVQGWPSWFSDCMGWDDVWAAGVGSTGYVATNGGASKKFRDRVATDVIPFAPDIVMVLGSINDTTPLTTVNSEASALVAQIKDALPDCLVVGGYNADGGVEDITATGLDLMDATKAGFVAGGGVWLNPIEMPLEWAGAVPQSTTTVSLAATRAMSTGISPFATGSGTTGIRCNTTLSSGVNLPVGHTVEIGSGAVRERKVINGVTQISANDYSYAGEGSLQYTHAAGEVVRVVGPSYLTGSGQVGTTTGWGNSDTLVSSDGTHPSADGHRELAYVQANLLRNYLASLTAGAF